MKIKQGIERFIKSFSSNGHSPLTAKRYEKILQGLPHGKDLSLIRPDHLQKHLDQFSTLSAPTKNQYKSAIKSFFKFCLENDFIPKDPSRLIQLERVPLKEANFLFEEDLGKLKIAIAENPRDQLMITLFWSTGLRLSELWGLNIEDVKDKSAFLIEGKGRKSRTVFLSPSLQSMIEKFVEGKTCKPLFTNRYGWDRLSKIAIQKIFKGYLAKAGIEKPYSIHSLRHTFLTNVYSKTLDLRLTQELAGHSSPAITARYSHLAESKKIETINSLFA